MVTRKKIMDEAGLSRWQIEKLAQVGFISKGETRTHPYAARGRATVHPDQDLVACKEIVRIMRDEGLSLHYAARQYQLDMAKKIIEKYTKSPSFAEVFKTKKIKLANGEESNLLEYFYNLIFSDIDRITEDRKLREKIIEKFEEGDALEYVINTALMGYSPVGIWDGVDLIIAPDFTLGHLFIPEQNQSKACILLPLLHNLNKIYKIITKDLPYKFEPTVYAASKVLAKEGRQITEYEFIPHGILGVELVKKTARKVGRARRRN